MASNIKKASSIIRRSFRTKRYALLDIKENCYTDVSPQKTGSSSKQDSLPTFRQSRVGSSSSNDENQTSEKTSSQSERGLRRSNVTQSMRDAVGTIRQKLRMSTRRSRVNITPTRAGKRRHTLAGHDVKMSSPFKIDTPSKSRQGRSQIKTCLSMETPTRLRREVEALTANMQALSALTPNTLQTRANARKTPPLTNGSLKTPRSSRKRITTDIF
ncbi:unnamed protein product [Lymnaea stagnalis]|uniref:Uncharacterized protein n=1 Tax=Lymnaea stagnalis TaxID=6523 RepID=A0AAV2I8H4_LYMST